jgi:uncharacterized phiE125 gp8 family phage protein
MQSSLLLIPATSEPITVQEAMAHCRVDELSEEAYFMGLISTVRSYVEGQTGRALAGETRLLVSDSWASSFALDRTPTATISSIKYQPSDESAEVTVSATDYFLAAGEPSKLLFKTSFAWPGLAARPDAVQITYTTAPSFIHPGLRASMLLMVAWLYEQRTPVSVGSTAIELPFHFRALLDSHRIGGFVA